MPLPVEAWQPPAGAVRNAELEAWEVAERDASGERHGDCKLYRDDGSLLSSCRYEAGKRNGPFTSYHSNGEVASKGSYVEGLLDGAFFRYSSAAPGTAPLRDCCVPPGARALRITYGRGTFLGETFYDGDGHALRSDGKPLPERASKVPNEAVFEENEERWVLRIALENDRMLRKSFDVDGRLVDEAEIDRGRRVALREYYPSAALLREIRFDEAGVPHGACVFRHTGDDTPYAERAIREVRGTYEHAQSVGTWCFLDADGNDLRTQERGQALSDERMNDLLAPEPSGSDADALFERAAQLFDERRVREALFVAARASARLGRADGLVELISRSIVPLEPEIATARAEMLEREERQSVQSAFDAMLSGADPAKIFRLLATLVPSAHPAARDLVDASLLLAPGSSRTLVTRALVRLEQGDVGGAIADARELDTEFGGAAVQIRELARVLFPKFSFTPALEPPTAPTEELAPVTVEQPLAAVRWAVSLYATRLGALREELRRRLGGEPEWLPPDPSGLLQAGPVELRRFTETITDEDEDGSETSEVEVDETLELSSASAASLMTLARADWDALCWLCWSAGLDDVVLPEAVTLRPDFAAAVNESMVRCFRAHDQVRTGGLVSQSRGVPSFLWDGLPIQTLSSRFAELAARQYLERRAALLFLLVPQNVSPFQSDLRKV
jgi:antitoxin component YwqK of YwqJK toxin-antitoxin module